MTTAEGIMLMLKLISAVNEYPYIKMSEITECPYTKLHVVIECRYINLHATTECPYTNLLVIMCSYSSEDDLA